MDLPDQPPGLARFSHARVPKQGLRPANMRRLGLLAWSLAVVLGGQACSPALDWRQLRPPEWQLSVAMPCRPVQQERELRLADTPVRMRLMACEVDKHVLAVTSADLRDPALVGPALAALTAAAQANVQGRLLSDGPVLVRGMTPHARARQWHFVGQRQDGTAFHLQGLVFAHGTRVFQAAVVGPSVSETLVRPFVDSLEIRP